MWMPHRACKELLELVIWPEQRRPRTDMTEFLNIKKYSYGLGGKSH